jgi:2-hydroxychromene-2-carboxylate isomerase
VKQHESSATRPFVARAFAAWWDESLDLADEGLIARLLAELGAPASGFAEFVRVEGPEALAALRTQLFAAGGYDVPAYRLGVEVFQGRQHLPLIRDLVRAQIQLAARTGV